MGKTEGEPQGPKKAAFGGVVINDEGKILLRRVTNNYKGYVWTFPKGRVGSGESPPEAALREVREETGYECTIHDVLCPFIEGLETRTLFYVMSPVRDYGDFHEETSEVRWVAFDEAIDMVALTEHEIGRTRDLTVLDAVERRGLCSHVVGNDSSDTSDD